MSVRSLSACLIIVAALFVGGAAYGGAPERLAPRPAPPAAQLETPRTVRTMAFGSYCWSELAAALCVDTVRVSGPLVVVRHGEVIRFHLGFQPSGAWLIVGRKTYRIPPWRTIPWRVRGASGIAHLFARRPGGGDASYFATLRTLPPPRPAGQ